MQNVEENLTELQKACKILDVEKIDALLADEKYDINEGECPLLYIPASSTNENALNTFKKILNNKRFTNVNGINEEDGEKTVLDYLITKATVNPAYEKFAIELVNSEKFQQINHTTKERDFLCQAISSDLVDLLKAILTNPNFKQIRYYKQNEYEKGLTFTPFDCLNISTKNYSRKKRVKKEKENILEMMINNELFDVETFYRNLTSLEEMIPETKFRELITKMLDKEEKEDIDRQVFDSIENYDVVKLKNILSKNSLSEEFYSYYLGYKKYRLIIEGFSAKGEKANKINELIEDKYKEQLGNGTIKIENMNSSEEQQYLQDAILSEKEINILKYTPIRNMIKREKNKDLIKHYLIYIMYKYKNAFETLRYQLNKEIERQKKEYSYLKNNSKPNQ